MIVHSIDIKTTHSLICHIINFRVRIEHSYIWIRISIIKLLRKPYKLMACYHGCVSSSIFGKILGLFNAVLMIA